MPHALFVVLLSLPLAGCLTAQERAAKVDMQDDERCRSYGAVPGSTPYINCRSQMQAARISAPVVVAAPPAAPAFNPSPPVTCMRTGNMTTCN